MHFLAAIVGAYKLLEPAEVEQIQCQEDSQI